eukprot:m.37994 g.37994  ORF g.37994 m.37994 type:complete len:551 (+) comp5607_c0_seq1:263-1915(+)
MVRGMDGPAQRAAALVIGLLVSAHPAGANLPDTLKINVVSSIPHPHASDMSPSFTEGLFIHDNKFYESGAQPSRILTYDMDGTLIHSVRNSEQFFAEGLAMHGDNLIQLSWQQHVARQFKLSTFQDHGTLERTGTFYYQGEGWGLCHNGEHIVMSNGSAWLQFRDPVSFELKRELEVKYNGVSASSMQITADPKNGYKATTSLRRINELECFSPSRNILANVWYSDRIISIRPSDGEITDVIDASAMYTYTPPSGTSCIEGHEVVNGIARDPSTGELWLTGKRFPCLFKVNVVDKDSHTVRDPWGPAAPTTAPTRAPTSVAPTAMPTSAPTSLPTAGPSEPTTVQVTTTADATLPRSSRSSSSTSSAVGMATTTVAGVEVEQGGDDVTLTTEPTTTVQVMGTSRPVVTTTVAAMLSSTSSPQPLFDDDANMDVSTPSTTTESGLPFFGIGPMYDAESGFDQMNMMIVVGLAVTVVLVALVIFMLVQRRKRYQLVTAPHEFSVDDFEESEGFLDAPSQLDTTQIEMESDGEEEDLVFRIPKRKGRFQRYRR